MENNLFDEDEWNQMLTPSLSTSPTVRVPDHLNILNYNLCQNLNFTGKYQMPVVQPIDCPIPQNIVAYYRTTTGNFPNCIPHFYTTDSHIEAAWTKPNEMLSRLIAKNSYIIGPDFSVYENLLLPQKIWNIYRNKCLVAWWQYNGLKVIPNVSWISHNYVCSFDGWPKNSVIAVNSTGVGNNEWCKVMWRKGYRKMLKVLQPKHILRYGAKQNGEEVSISTYYPNDNLKIVRYGR